MIKYFETELREKVKDSQSEILYAQWCYDKKVIPMALQAVSNIFPHYSLHDESHSLTIINNIIRIIGKDNIKQLSAIDIWLILEAAYCHDLGMIILNEDIVNAINSSDFISFFKKMISDTKGNLSEFTNKFSINDKNQIEIKSKLFDIEIIDSIKYVLADYFRAQHAKRSGDFITNPHKLSLPSPRGVIPPRIIKLLSDISSSHTKSFEDVMRLPFSEVGIDIEDAHPRFVACMLRIGDLLDLDNNRFSEVMLRTLSKIPIDTLIHKAKHMSIESFRIDNEIEIMARCENYDTANITQHWFNYINTEFRDQINYWNKIVPQKELFNLPMIGNLQVALTEYEFIDGKIKPAFSIDRDKALELFQGTGLYEYPQQCIRELLQNAVDASLIRMWLEHHEEIDFPQNPQDDKYFALTREYPIHINMFPETISDGYETWVIEIVDNGIGISKQDIKYMINTGSSSKNETKKLIIDQMPVWMKPSGVFGIGFQSVFLMTDSVEIKTKSYLSDEVQIIELNNPKSSKNGDVFLKKTDSSILKRKYGCQLTFKHKISISEERDIKPIQESARETLRNYDPFSGMKMPAIEVINIIDEIKVFNERCLFPINLTVSDSIVSLKQKEIRFNYFDNENCLELKIGDFMPEQGSIRLYFKNQSLKTIFRNHFCNVDINILNEDATEILTLNRNEIRHDKILFLMDRIRKSICQIIEKGFDKIYHDNYKQLGSMFLSYNKRNINDYWKQYTLKIGDQEYSIGKLFEYDKIEIVDRFNKNTDETFCKQFEIVGDLLKINFHSRSYVDSITTFILSQIKNYYSSITIKLFPGDRTEILFTKEPQKEMIIEDEYFKYMLSGANLVNGASVMSTL